MVKFLVQCKWCQLIPIKTEAWTANNCRFITTLDLRISVFPDSQKKPPTKHTGSYDLKRTTELSRCVLENEKIPSSRLQPFFCPFIYSTQNWSFSGILILWSTFICSIIAFWAHLTICHIQICFIFHWQRQNIAAC